MASNTQRDADIAEEQLIKQKAASSTRKAFSVTAVLSFILLAPVASLVPVSIYLIHQQAPAEAAAVPEWVVSVQRYDRMRQLKVALVLLYIAIFVYPVEDHDNTACSIWNQRKSPFTLLTRFQRAVLWSVGVGAHAFHVSVANVVQAPVPLTLAFVFVFWVCWDRQMCDAFPWYKNVLDRYVRVPGLANFHDLVSLFAMLGASSMPLAVRREHSLDVFTAAQTSGALLLLVIGYVVLYILNPKPDKATILVDERSDETQRRLRVFWWLNVYEATLIAAAAGAI